MSARRGHFLGLLPTTVLTVLATLASSGAEGRTSVVAVPVRVPVLVPEVPDTNPIKQALFLGNLTISNLTLGDCIFRRGSDRDPCPDPSVRYVLYPGGPESKPATLNPFHPGDLRALGWMPDREDVFIVHGYAGGDDTLPIAVLRDAYIATGNYNVWMVDWGALSPAPCYSASAHNMRPVARCFGKLLEQLRAEGLPVEKATCVGHSLGAHLCGLVSNYVNFRLYRIIGLDPARPLIRNGAPNRLDPGDALFVQVIHTNAGVYGEGGKMGHVDVCINGGRSQPYCVNSTNEPLCSHIWSVCYMAESINRVNGRQAEPCLRRCPTGTRPTVQMGMPIMIGQHTPEHAFGSYCINDSRPPFCPDSPGEPGDPRCCIEPPPISNAV